MSRVRKSIWYLLIGLGVVVTAALSWVAGILEPKDLPTVRGVDLGGVVESHPLLTFLLLLAAAILIAVLTEVFGRGEQTSQEEPVEFTPQLRAGLLDVLGTRYKKRLEDPREQKVWLELGLKETPQALAPDPNLRLVGNRENRPVDRGKSIEDLFDEPRLLILGEPGAGKTTMLLQLALDLIERAEEDSSEPVPVVVNLASWARHGGSIREWLVEDALQNQANVGQEDLARTLIEGNYLLLLLDGLDEIEDTRREGCVAAINDYLDEVPGRMVVCSRTEEYEQTGEQLALERAVQIEPLQPDQVIDELEEHSETEGLREMLREDDQLRELATTPLNVSVMLLAYGGKSASEVQAETTAERRRVLWNDYVTRMLARKPTEYAPENILKWLSWLATKMRQDDMTRFIPDRMQPTWLDDLSSYRWTVRLVFGIASGLVFWLVFGPVGGLAFGLAFGLVFGVLRSILYGGVGEILKFDILRFLLWREGLIPWRYFHFLQEAADLLLLEQDGGAVEFRHLLLRDYFAELTPEHIKELSARIDRASPG